MSKLVASPLADLRRLLERVRLDGEIDLIYEHGDFDNLHVWLLWDGFAGQGQDLRDAAVRDAFGELPLRTLTRITLFYPMTHADFEEQFEHRADEFGEPAADEGGDGPFRLTRLAARAAA